MQDNDTLTGSSALQLSGVLPVGVGETLELNLVEVPQELRLHRG